EEGGLDRYAVDDAADGAAFGTDVVPEDACAAPVREQQRREEPDERRLARAVLTQDRDALTAFDLEGDAGERGHADASATLAPTELLAQVVDFHGEHVLLPRLDSTDTETERALRQTPGRRAR